MRVDVAIKEVFPNGAEFSEFHKFVLAHAANKMLMRRLKEPTELAQIAIFLVIGNTAGDIRDRDP